MARYFFHLYDGIDKLMDPEGREVADASLLEVIALKDARSMISQDALTGRIVLDLSIEVRDEGGKLVHRLSFRDAVLIS